MKKLIATTLLLLPVTGLAEMVQHDFTIDELPAPTVSTSSFRLTANPNTTIYSSTLYNCTIDRKGWKCLGSYKTSEKFLYRAKFGDNFTHVSFKCSPTDLFEAHVGFSLGGPRSYLVMGSTSTGIVPIEPGNRSDLYAEYFYMVGSIGGAGSSAECTIYGGTATQPYHTPIGKFLLGSDFGSNGTPFGLTITPSILPVSGRPAWSGTVRIKGSGYAGRLMIQSDRDIRINLGRGWSGSGRSFETKLLSGDVPLNYEGQMHVAGEVLTPGLTTYNVQVTHEIESESY